MGSKKRSARAPKAQSRLPSFGRENEPHERLTDIGCPDCSGVLTVAESQKDFFTFRCRVGHAFSLETLLPLKEDAFERALWSATEISEELGALHAEVARRARARKSSAVARTSLRRKTLARSHEDRLRAMVAEAGPGAGPRRSKA